MVHGEKEARLWLDHIKLLHCYEHGPTHPISDKSRGIISRGMAAAVGRAWAEELIQYLDDCPDLTDVKEKIIRMRDERDT